MSTESTVYVFNGPNLNLLGGREPGVYGTATLADVEQLCRTTAQSLGLEVDVRQSNCEGALVDAVQEARSTRAGIVINPAAYSHTSIALMDALAACDLPVVEVHLSNIHRRAEFRHTSYVSKVASAVIAGCGAQGYAFALQRVAALLPSTPA